MLKFLCVEYLIKIATRLHEAVLVHKLPLWRAKLTTTAVVPGQLSFKGSLEWVPEDCVRKGLDSVQTTLAPVLADACCAFANEFNDGAYLGGHCGSGSSIFQGAQPPAVVEHTFVLGAPFVLGQAYDAGQHICKKMQLELAALL